MDDETKLDSTSQLNSIVDPNLNEKSTMWYNGIPTVWVLNLGFTVNISSTKLYVFFVYNCEMAGDLHLWCIRPDPNSNFLFLIYILVSILVLVKIFTVSWRTLSKQQVVGKGFVTRIVAGRV